MISAVPMIPQYTPPGPLKDEDIPEASGVYMVFSGQECLYVGQSRNIRRRWQVHEHRAKFRRAVPAATLAWMLAPVSDLRLLERRTAEALRPRLNRHLKACVSAESLAIAPLYTVPEVAKRLQVTEKTVCAWIRDKELTAIRIGREWRLRDEDVEAFLERRLSTATQEIHGTGD
jgi:excisionase family DNA binding protein